MTNKDKNEYRVNSHISIGSFMIHILGNHQGGEGGSEWLR